MKNKQPKLTEIDKWTNAAAARNQAITIKLDVLMNPFQDIIKAVQEYRASIQKLLEAQELEINQLKNVVMRLTADVGKLTENKPKKEPDS